MKIVVYDLETNGVDITKCEPKLAGFKSSEFKGFKYTSDIKEMVSILNKADIIVGYNIKAFDNPIMERYGVNFKYKTLIDLYEVADKRRMLVKVNGKYLHTQMTNRTMDLLSEILGGPAKIKGDDIDYSWFKQDFHTLPADIQEKAVLYLKRDIDMTEFIYDWFEKYFSDFKEYLKPKQIQRKQYITASTASLAYKCLCNLANIKEKYADDDPQDFEGGYVALPSREIVKGEIYCLDFNSLYPHIMIQANLYGRVKDVNSSRKTWKGEGISKTKGTYYADKLSPVSQVLKDLYNKRLEYKASNDQREYTIKIIINTIYGLLGKSVFASVNDWVAAEDCTKLGQQWTKYARKRFIADGYEALYTDTDSVYVLDRYKDKEKLLNLVKDIIKNIKDSVPFPQDTFDMGVDDEIKLMMFGKGVSGDLLKKNYMYLTNDNKLKIKGFQIIKGTASKIGTEVFKRFIEPEIIKNMTCKFPRSVIFQWIYKLLNEDIGNAAITYKVKDRELYKKNGQIQAQISEHPLYGPGEHKIIKLKHNVAHKKGVGINKNYVGLKYKDEIKKYHIDLEKPKKELDPFTADPQTGLNNYLRI